MARIARLVEGIFMQAWMDGIDTRSFSQIISPGGEDDGFEGVVNRAPSQICSVASNSKRDRKKDIITTCECIKSFLLGTFCSISEGSSIDFKQKRRIGVIIQLLKLLRRNKEDVESAIVMDTTAALVRRTMKLVVVFFFYQWIIKATEIIQATWFPIQVCTLIASLIAMKVCESI